VQRPHTIVNVRLRKRKPAASACANHKLGECDYHFVDSTGRRMGTGGTLAHPHPHP